jgi:basic membrane protein A
MIKRVDNAVYDIVNDVVNHRFQGGFHVFGLDSAGVGYVVDQYNKDLVPPETIKEAEEAKRKIVGKQITVIDRMTQ